MKQKLQESTLLQQYYIQYVNKVEYIYLTGIIIS